jgi:hypothetical protein
MIHIASTPPSQFGVAGQISHSENPDWLYGQTINLLFASGSVVKYW